MTVYCAYIDLENKKSEIFCDTGEITEIDGFRICDHINMSASTVCFVPSVKVIKLLYPGGIEESDEYYRNSDTDILVYKYGKCEFRSFGALIGMQNTKVLQTMYKGMPISSAMYEYLCGIGDPKKIKYTLAYQAKKMFYSDIAEDLWQERKDKKKFYWDKETYWDMMAGVKGGVLSDYRAKYIEDVLMYDLRSAYAAVLVSDDKFPIGKIIKIDCNKPEYKITKIKVLLKKGEWCKIVFDRKNDDFSRWYDVKGEKTAFEYYNLKTLERLNLLDNLFEYLRTVEFRVYYSKETGYINKSVRDKIVNLYKEKERLQKDTFERYLTKTQIEMIYGKGIQRYDFDNIVDIQDHYRGRGENYLTPEMSNHCIAKVEHDMYKAINTTRSEEYYDTDGIKVQNNAKSIAYFKAENEAIMERNRKAGYDDLDIGTWKFEGKADKMLIFTPKIYIYECDGEIEFKAAGVTKEYKEKILNGIKGDKIEFMRKHGFITCMRAYKYDAGDFIPYYTTGKVKGDLCD